MIKMVPVVRAATRTFARAAALELGSARSGDQIGALLAGAWALWNDEAPTEAQAVDLIKNADWGVQRIQAEESGGDQRRCLDTILQHRLRVEVERGALSRTVAELIDLADGIGNPMEPISPAAAEAELGRNGIRVYEDRLFVSNTARGVAAILKDTPWADGGWGNLLGSLPGAFKNRPTRFRGMGMSRCVSVPRSLFRTGD
jgi:putative DNA primase/helicase